MKASNINSVMLLLKNESSSKKSILTKPLLVVSTDSNSITVASSRDADVLIKLRDITGISVNSTVTVDTKTGEVTVVEAAAAPAPARSTGSSQGCMDRSAIVR